MYQVRLIPLSRKVLKSERYFHYVALTGFFVPFKHLYVLFDKFLLFLKQNSRICLL